MTLRKLFGKLPDLFIREARRYVTPLISKIRPYFSNLDKESVSVEERVFRQILINWEELKRIIRDVRVRSGVEEKNRYKLDSLIHVIDSKFRLLARDISSEAHLDEDIAVQEAAAEKDEAKEEGAPGESTPAELAADAKVEEGVAKQEEAAVAAGEK